MAGAHRRGPVRARGLRRPGDVRAAVAGAGGVRPLARRAGQPGLLPGHSPAAVRHHRREHRQGRAGHARGRRVRPRRHREAVRLGRGQCPRPLRGPVDGVHRGADLPDRPLPRQGDGAEPARAAVRQLDLRADLEPRVGRQRADHRRRDHRRRGPRRLLRDRRRHARHRAEPRAAGALAVPHGAADVVPRRGHPRREGQAAPGDPAAGRRAGHRGRHRPRAVQPRRHPRAADARLPRGAGSTR